MFIYVFLTHYSPKENNLINCFMKYFLSAVFCFVFFYFPAYLQAQPGQTYPPEYIKTVQFKGTSAFSGLPVIKLGTGFTLEFDDLVGDEADYYYKISYYNADWSPSELSKNEFLQGYDNNRIRNYKNSFNTLQIYTHYQLSIPNTEVQALKISGNYRIEIYDTDNELVFSRPFIVYENLVSIPTEVKRSRDLKYINTHQVINFSIENTDRFSISNPDQNLHTLILKNHHFEDAITGLKPQYRTGQKLVYRYDREASFEAGNEYLFFDSKDVRSTANNVQYTELKNIYNLHLYTDLPRYNQTYTYNPDINGNYKINTIHGSDTDIESEYVWVHFYLKEDRPLPNGKIHVYGGFNNYQTDESTQLTFNPETALYEGRVLFKQGFYNYKYVWQHPDGTIDKGYFDGNFDKTENDYTVIAYYRETGARYDRVIGIGQANSSTITN